MLDSRKLDGEKKKRTLTIIDVQPPLPIDIPPSFLLDNLFTTISDTIRKNDPFTVLSLSLSLSRGRGGEGAAA